MLRTEERMELAVLRKHGTSIRELARVTGRSRNTVWRYLRGGEAAVTRKAAPKRPKKLDPFKPYIIERRGAAASDRIPAAALFREIQACGYAGGETRLKQFVRGLAPVPASRPIVRFETEPGHQMQADWATVGRGADKLKVFIATLGRSRATYVEFCDGERVEALPAAFRMMKAMQAEGVEWGEDYRAAARCTLAELLEGRMAATIDRHLERMAESGEADRRNGCYTRWLLTELGEIELHVPRTRTFSALKVVRAYARRAKAVDRMILACFLLGLSTRKVALALLPILGRPVSPATVSTVARQLDAAVANKTLDLFLVRMELKTVEPCSRL